MDIDNYGHHRTYYTMSDVWDMPNYEEGYEEFIKPCLPNIENRCFFEIEDLLSTSQEYNYPIIVLLPQEIDHAAFILSYKQYTQKIRVNNDNLHFPIYLKVNQSSQNINNTLYNLVVALRTAFDLLPELPSTRFMLKQQFGYWLGLAADTISELVVLDSQIYIYIANAEMLKDGPISASKGMSYWLPKILPQKVRIILTTYPGSDIDEYYRISPSERIDLSARLEEPEFDKIIRMENDGLAEAIYRKLNSTLIVQSLFRSLFRRLFLQTAHQKHKHKKAIYYMQQLMMNSKKLANCETVTSFITLYFRKVNKAIRKFCVGEFGVEQVKDYVIYHHMVTYGLLDEEIEMLVNASHEQVDLLNSIFSGLTSRIKDKLTVMIQRQYEDYFFGESTNIEINKKYASLGNAMKLLNPTIRRILEYSSALTKSKNLYLLKNELSKVEVFLIFYNPFYKIQYLQYWETLIASRFDPVYEFTRALESFETHVKPSEPDLFFVIFQLGRFFYDLVNYEDDNFPESKHPKIINRIAGFGDSLCIEHDLKEFSKITLSVLEYIESHSYPKLSLQIVESKATKIPREIDLSLQIFSSVAESDLSKVHITKTTQQTQPQNYLLELGLLNYLSKFSLVMMPNTTQSALRSYEKINIDTPTGINNCINAFRSLIQKHEQNRFKKMKIGEDESDNLAIPKGQFYYYKRWIWIMFPHACMSVDYALNYSALMNFCYKRNKHGIQQRYDEIISKIMISIARDSEFKIRGVTKDDDDETDLVVAPLAKKIAKIPDKVSINKKKQQISESTYERNDSSTRPKNSMNNTMTRFNITDEFKNTRRKSLLTSHGKTYGSNFFMTEIQDKEKRAQTSIAHRGNSEKRVKKQRLLNNTVVENRRSNSPISKLHLSSVASRSIAKDLKKRLFSTLSTAPSNPSELIKGINSAMHENSTMYIKFIERSNEEKICALNNLKFQRKNLTRQLKEIEKKYLMVRLIDTENHSQIKGEGDINLKISEITYKYEEVTRVEARFHKIIEVCKINVQINDDWIKQLDGFLDNMKKMVVLLQQKIEVELEEKTQISEMLTVVQRELRKQQSINKAMSSQINKKLANIRETLEIRRRNQGDKQESPESPASPSSEVKTASPKLRIILEKRGVLRKKLTAVVEFKRRKNSQKQNVLYSKLIDIASALQIKIESVTLLHNVSTDPRFMQMIDKYKKLRIQRYMLEELKEKRDNLKVQLEQNIDKIEFFGFLRDSKLVEEKKKFAKRYPQFFEIANRLENCKIEREKTTGKLEEKYMAIENFLIAVNSSLGQHGAINDSRRAVKQLRSLIILCKEQYFRKNIKVHVKKNSFLMDVFSSRKNEVNTLFKSGNFLKP